MNPVAGHDGEIVRRRGRLVHRPGGLMRHRLIYLIGLVANGLRLAPTPVIVPVEPVRAWRKYRKVAVGDLPAIQQVRRWWRDASVRSEPASDGPA